MADEGNQEATKDLASSIGNASAGPSLDMGCLTRILGFHLRMANVAIFQDYQATMAGLSLTPKQFTVLELIGCNPGVVQIDIAELLSMDKATTMALVDRLEARSLLERRPSLIDRRRKELFLTEEGKEVLQEARELIALHEKRFTSRFSEAELKSFVEQLRRIYLSDQDPLEDHTSADSVDTADAP